MSRGCPSWLIICTMLVTILIGICILGSQEEKSTLFDQATALKAKAPVVDKSIRDLESMLNHNSEIQDGLRHLEARSKEVQEEKHRLSEETTILKSKAQAIEKSIPELEIMVNQHSEVKANLERLQVRTKQVQHEKSYLEEETNQMRNKAQTTLKSIQRLQSVLNQNSEIRDGLKLLEVRIKEADERTMVLMWMGAGMVVVSLVIMTQLDLAKAKEERIVKETEILGRVQIKTLEVNGQVRRRELEAMETMARMKLESDRAILATAQWNATSEMAKSITQIEQRKMIQWKEEKNSSVFSAVGNVVGGVFRAFF